VDGRAPAAYQTQRRARAPNISGAQRLPNGNTLITEGAGGRVFEVTAPPSEKAVTPPALGDFAVP